MKYWLMKSEPESFSIDDLANAPNQTTNWDGVRNYQARNFMRDEMKCGDKVIFYHSNSEPSGAVGYCEVVKEAYPDTSAFNPESKYYDPKSNFEKPSWYMVDIKLLEKFQRIIPLSEMRDNSKLQNMQLVKKGNRLSVLPVTRDEYNEILKMSKK